ncbi:MAG: hypothetical protein IK115_05055 [Lachnospiraceae bacterium]|nr:hypothetical protein [Lachnospiraceae bacterium]
MEYLAIAVLILILLLGILTRGEEVPEECNASTLTRPFYRMASRLESCLRGAPEKLRNRVFQKNEERLRLLEPGADIPKLSRLQFISKCGTALLFLTVGMIFGLLLCVRERGESVFDAEGGLPRREWGKGDYSVELNAVSGEESRPVEILVEERQYSTEEIREMLPEFHQALETALLAKNKDPGHVDTDIDPVTAVEGYPFGIDWEFSDRTLFRRDGVMKEDIPENGKLVTLTAIVSYGDFSELYAFDLMVFPKASGEDPFALALQKALQKADAESGTKNSFVLPAEADGISVYWEEKKSRSMAVLILFVPLVAVGIFWGKDKDLEKRLKERDLQMTMDYPELVSKLSLYIGAGMSTRVAWRKLCEEYRKKGIKRYVYDEMILTVREMERGCSELVAYRNFAKRCRLQKFVKLVSLLEQNTKLGAAGFLSTLRTESSEALQERKTIARRLGEEAGTKLLLPMILMLAIVMVVIIVPAFVSI